MLDDMFRKSGGAKPQGTTPRQPHRAMQASTVNPSGHRLPSETAAKATKPVSKRCWPHLHPMPLFHHWTARRL